MTLRLAHSQLQMTLWEAISATSDSIKAKRKYDMKRRTILGWPDRHLQKLRKRSLSRSPQNSMIPFGILKIFLHANLPRPPRKPQAYLVACLLNREALIEGEK
jgi:hypothetical protein